MSNIEKVLCFLYILKKTENAAKPLRKVLWNPLTWVYLVTVILLAGIIFGAIEAIWSWMKNY